MGIRKYSINKNILLQYILIYMTYLLNSSIYQEKFPVLLPLVGLLISAFVILGKGKRPTNLFLISIAILFVVILFDSYFIGGLGLKTFLTWSAGILVPYSAYLLKKEAFFENYIKFIKIISIISVLLWLITLFVPSLWMFISLSFEHPSMSTIPFRQIPFIHCAAIGYIGDKASRNLSLFAEPGLTQIPFNSAVFILLLYPELLKGMSERKKTQAFICTVIAILSMQSTTGYIGLLIILMAFGISKNKGKLKKRITYVLIALAMGLVVDFIVRRSNSILTTVIISKLFSDGSFDLSAHSHSRVRLVGIEYALSMIKEHPFGVGYTGYFHNNVADSVRGVGGIVLASFAIFGIPQATLIYSTLIVNGIKNTKNIQVFIVALLLYINTTLAQSEIMYSCLVFLFFIPLHTNAHKEHKLRNVVANNKFQRPIIIGNIENS